MQSVTPWPSPPQPVTTRPDPVETAIRLALERAHPGGVLPLDDDIARAARLAVNRLDPLQHGNALTAATHTVSDRFAADSILDARTIAVSAVRVYLRTLTEGNPS